MRDVYLVCLVAAGVLHERGSLTGTYRWLDVRGSTNNDDDDAVSAATIIIVIVIRDDDLI